MDSIITISEGVKWLLHIFDVFSMFLNSPAPLAFLFSFIVTALGIKIVLGAL